MMPAQEPRLSPLLSVCIPAYNRPDELILVLRSIAAQGEGPWDVVICEDKSPREEDIAHVVREFSDTHPALSIQFHTNEKSLGYDGNLRRLLDKASGEYCLFMGDDDLLTSGALPRIVNSLTCPNVGFIVRAWKSVDKDTGEDIEEHRYFPEDRLFPAGMESIAALYRRSVFISGLTVHRETAREFHTNRFDGLLLYQLYLLGRILCCMNGYYVSDLIALRRVGGEHFFGSSDTEKERFVPKQLLPSHSLAFLKGLFDIARALEQECLPGLFTLIKEDLGHYSYPMLEIQSRNLSKSEFRLYALKLAELGLGSSRMFRLYFYMLYLLGSSITNPFIRYLKRLLGHTPNLGGSRGVIVK